MYASTSAPATVRAARGHGTRKECFRMQNQTTAARDGIAVASGYGLKPYINRGHLVIHDGIGRQRQTRRFHRATSGLEHAVVIGHTGFVSFEALRWLRDIGAAYIQLDNGGSLLAASASPGSNRP